MAQPEVYQFRVALQRISPKISRRIQLLGSQSLADLHFAIQHDPAEAYLRVDSEQKFRQLRLTELSIQSRSQLNELWCLRFGRQRRQMQLIVYPDLTCLGGSSNCSDTCLRPLHKRRQKRLDMPG
jgi:hypothetical protein